MKKLIATLMATLLVSGAYAQDAVKFAEHKKMVLAEMEKAISLIQTEKSCVESAADHAAIQKCRESAKSEREKLHSERKQLRAQKIDEQMKKLQEEKTKLETEKKN